MALLIPTGADWAVRPLEAAQIVDVIKQLLTTLNVARWDKKNLEACVPTAVRAM